VKTQKTPNYKPLGLLEYCHKYFSDLRFYTVDHSKLENGQKKPIFIEPVTEKSCLRMWEHFFKRFD